MLRAKPRFLPNSPVNESLRPCLGGAAVAGVAAASADGDAVHGNLKKGQNITFKQEVIPVLVVRFAFYLLSFSSHQRGRGKGL